MYRFFIKEEYINGKMVRFNESQAKQMRKVLRMKMGDKVEGFDGTGSEYVIEVLKLTHSDTFGKIVEEKFSERESNIILYQALPKNLKIEFILQKCTELGVDKIVFFESEFSQIDAKGISQEKLERWKRIATEASEQSRRVFVPEIELSTFGVKGILENLEKFEGARFFMDKKGEWFSKYSKEVQSKEIAFFIGPEGGFSPNEVNLFDQFACTKTRISQNILRSETAGMVVLAQLEVLKNL